MKKIALNESVILLIAVVLGAAFGIFVPDFAEVLKPIGAIFLNLLIVIVCPLVFLSVVNAVMNTKKNTSTYVKRAILSFLTLGVVSAVVMFIGVKLTNLTANVPLATEVEQQQISLADQIVHTFSAPTFPDLFTRQYMLALLIFSVILALGIRAQGEKGDVLKKFFSSLLDVFMYMIGWIMKYVAPIGLFSFFAAFLAEIGETFITGYLKWLALYYIISILFFFVGFSIIILLKKFPLGTFWKYNLTPSLVAISTQSSMATLPANFDATRKMGVKEEVRQLVLPLGANMNKIGSVMGAVVKIGFLFALMDRELTWTHLPVVILLAIVVGIVIGGIPSGGYIGEMFIISALALPIEALPLIVVIGTIIDPPATLLNATGNNLATIMTDKRI